MRKFTFFVTCLLISINLAVAQTQRITGTVVDQSNNPVIGATVLVKGTQIGVTTNPDGSFVINVPNNNKTLEVSYLGYETQDVQAVPNMKVTLSEATQMVEDIVVTGVYNIDKRLSTGATDKLAASDVKLDGMPEISRALEGRSAGVSVQNVSGTFGTAPKIRVRGATSILGDSKPLWVVDGVIMEDVTEVSADDLSSGDAVTLISSAIAGLNSDDIESFQILKDGSATSIYGARAMAGVIVVTTKRGQAGVSRISYTGEFTTRLKPSYRDFNIMNSQEQMDVYREMRTKGWLNLAPTLRRGSSGVFGKMYELINTYDPVTGDLMLENTEAAKQAYLQQAEMRNTDWFDLLFSNNIMMNHSVSISTGNEKATSYFSMSAMNDPGWTKASDVQRYTANANSSFNIVKPLTLNLLASASYRKQKAPGTLSQEADPVNGEVRRDFDINPYSYALNTSRTLDPNEYYTRNYAPFNILNELANNFIELNVVDMRFQGELKWKILKNLQITALGSVKYSSTSNAHKIMDNSNQSLAYRSMADATIRDSNPFLYKDPDVNNSLPVTVLPNGGFYEKREYRMFGWDFRTTLSYNNVWRDNAGRDHIFNVIGGAEVNVVNRSNDWFRGWGMQYDMGEMPFYNYLAFKQSSEANSDYFSLTNTRGRIAAFYANAAYSFDDRYALNATIRYEGTNKLGKSRSARWLPTWNVSGAWNIHNEKFMQNIRKAVSHLSLRASYSLTADSGPAWVSNSRVVIANYKPWRPSANVQEPGLTIDQLENSELTYEKKHELNIGLDMGFIDNRINLTIDAYKRNNYDLIGQVTTQGVGGEVTKYANMASMKSHGIELTLSTRNIVTRNFTWTTDFIFSYSKNKITELDTKQSVLDLITNVGYARQGYPVRGLFSIPFLGLNDDGLPTFLNQEGNIVSYENYSDLNFQERDMVDFLKYEGPTDPTISGSFGNVFSWKGLRLNVFITYSAGNVIRLDPYFRSSYSDLDAMPREFRNRWMMPGDEKKTDVPVIIDAWSNELFQNLSRAYNAYNYSSARIAKGDFIRMKEISLSYDFPKRLVNRWKMSNLSLKFQATNLFLIYSDKNLRGQDPEFFNSGGVSVPVPKQFTLTLRIGF